MVVIMLAARVKDKGDFGGGESIRDKLNLKYNVHRHIDRMSNIIADPNMDESRYNWSIEHLLTLLKPYGDDDTKFVENLNKIRDIYDGKEVNGIRKGGLIKAAKTSRESDELIKERNRKIFLELSYLIKRLRLGLELEGSEDIGG